MRKSVRIEETLTPIIPMIGNVIRAHPGTISLGQGIVGYPPPREALNALDPATVDPVYGPDEGNQDLREALAAKLEHENRIPISDTSRIVVTAGSNMAFMHSVLAIADAGDEIIFQTPYYFNHHMAVTIAGCRPVSVPTDANYQLQPDAIERAITPRTRAVVTISPNNPTGAVYSEESLRAVNAICRSRGIYHIHDEAYEYFTYGDVKHFSPGSITGASDHTISLFTFSKAYALASWRVGYMVIPSDLLESIYKIQDTVIICATVAAQHVALGALKCGPGYCREQVKRLAAVREKVHAAFASIPDICEIGSPQGAFYCFPRVKTGIDSMALVERLIDEHRVAALPGSVFGTEGGCYLRVSYGALEAGTVEEGMGRLVRGLKKICAEC